MLIQVKVNLGSLRNVRVDPRINISLLVSIMKNNLQHELNLILRRKFDEVNEVLKINYMMVELLKNKKFQKELEIRTGLQEAFLWWGPQ